jgi:hypothetical protein
MISCRVASILALTALVSLTVMVGAVPPWAGAQPPDAPAEAGDAGAGADDAPWFVNVAAATGLAGAKAARVKFADFDGDGFVDVLVSTFGRDWRDAFLTANKLPDGLPRETGEDGKLLPGKISRDDWPGESEAFDRFDFDDDGVFTQAELKLAMEMNSLVLLMSKEADAPARRFVDVTAGSNIRANVFGTDRGRLSRLVLAADADDDGDLDLFYGTWQDLENPANQTYDVGDRDGWALNDGSGNFAPLKPAEMLKAEPSDFPSTLSAACVVDVNNDGKLDLFTGSWYRQYGRAYDGYPDRLYLGDGEGRFTDATEGAGLMLDRSPFDALTEEERETGQVGPDRVGVIGRTSHRPTFGVAHADWDGDGDQDLFALAYGRQWNLHWENLGNGKFRDVAEATGFDGDGERSGQYPPQVRRRPELPFRSNGNTFSIALGDVNGDALIDAVLGEIRHGWAGASSDPSMLLINRGADADFAFRRDTKAIARKHDGLNFNEGDINVGFIDADNDGRLDVLISSSDYPDDQRLRLFHQQPDGGFTDVTGAIGLNWPHSHQLSLADFDRDGDLDILVGRNHMRLPGPMREANPLGVALWRNDIANRSGNHFLSLSLRGKGWRDKGANRFGIGARVIVTTGDRRQVQSVSGGHGHVGMQNDTRLIFGLGKAETADRIEIHWGGPAGTVDIFEDVAADKFYRANEGAEELTADTTDD